MSYYDDRSRPISLNEIIFVLFIIIFISISFLIYNNFIKNKTTSTEFIPKLNLSIKNTSTLQDLAESKRYLKIIVNKTIKINKTTKCINSKIENFCENINGTKIKLPFIYDLNFKYSVFFYNDEVYIINENQNTNPSISYFSLKPFS